MYLLSIVYAFHAYLPALLGVFLDAEACAGCMRFCHLAVSRVRSPSIYLLYSYSSVHAIPVSRDCRLDRVNLIAIRTLRRIVVKSTTRSFAANQPPCWSYARRFILRSLVKSSSQAHPAGDDHDVGDLKNSAYILGQESVAAFLPNRPFACPAGPQSQNTVRIHDGTQPQVPR